MFELLLGSLFIPEVLEAAGITAGTLAETAQAVAPVADAVMTLKGAGDGLSEAGEIAKTVSDIGPGLEEAANMDFALESAMGEAGKSGSDIAAEAANVPGINHGSEMFSFDFGDPEMNKIASEGAEAAIAENPKSVLAEAWDGAKGVGEQMWNRGKQDLKNLVDSHVVKKSDGSINWGKTAGNVGYTALKTAATRALSNASAGGKQAAQNPMPQAQLPKMKVPQARTPDADEALKQLMNMMHNS